VRYFESADLSLIDVTAPIAQLASKVRAEFKLKVPDAIHVATAEFCGCELLVSFDNNFARCNGKFTFEVNVVPLE
jgi:predicted nucleic acid-binding protein